MTEKMKKKLKLVKKVQAMESLTSIKTFINLNCLWQQRSANVKIFSQDLHKR